MAHSSDGHLVDRTATDRGRRGAPHIEQSHSPIHVFRPHSAQRHTKPGQAPSTIRAPLAAIMVLPPLCRNFVTAHRLDPLCRAMWSGGFCDGGEMPVYFIRNERVGLTKVGYSANVRRRVESLRTASGDRLTLLRALVGGTDLEFALHSQFKELHERGEWFRLTDKHISADYGVPDAAGVVDSVPAGHGRLRLGRGRLKLQTTGKQPLSNAQRQKIHRERVKEQLEAGEEAVMFVLALRPGRIAARTLVKLQRKLEAQGAA